MHEGRMEQAVSHEKVVAALRAVQRNAGAAGIDGMTVKQLESHLRRHWESVRAKLLAGTYTPSPVRRVEIPKPTGGTRALGIPTVLDRFVQQLVLQELQPIFEPLFSEHSYGFRPGRSAHDAVRAAREFVRQGKSWVVDIDITKFFDRVHHDKLMHRIGQVVRDKRLLRLIGSYLRSGVLVEGVYWRQPKARRKVGRCRRCWRTSIWTPWTRNWSDAGWPSVATRTTAICMSAVPVRRRGCWPASATGWHANCGWK